MKSCKWYEVRKIHVCWHLPGPPPSKTSKLCLAIWVRPPLKRVVMKQPYFGDNEKNMFIGLINARWNSSWILHPNLIVRGSKPWDFQWTCGATWNYDVRAARNFFLSGGKDAASDSRGLQALRQEAASTCQAKAKYRHWRHDIESPAPLCTTAVAPGSRIDRTDRGQVAVHSDFHAEATTLAVNLRFLLVSSSCFIGMPPIFGRWIMVKYGISCIYR